MVDLYGDVLSVWRDWAGDRLDGGPIASGHHIAEEAPEALVIALREFWRSTEGHGPRGEYSTGAR
jgi:haloacetate dehalogenase